ncbi:hypothetical protein D3C76_1040570 [compost metagenome]
MLGDVVFVGDQHGGNRRVILVGQARVAVHVAQIILGKAFHGPLDRLVYVRIALEVGDAILVLRQFIEGKDVVVSPEGSLNVHVEPYIDALILEALDPQVELLQRFFAQALGIMHFPAVTEDVGKDPPRIMVVQSHQVETQGREALGLQLDRIVGCLK